MLASDIQAKWKQLRQRRIELQRYNAEFLAAGKIAAKEVDALKELSRRLRLEIGENAELGEGHATGSVEEISAEIAADIETTIASYWRPDQDTRDLEELIRLLDTLDIRVGIQTTPEGVIMWVSDRNFRNRCERLVRRDRIGLIPGVSAIAQCLHEAAIKGFPKYADLHKAEQQRPATDHLG